jgi:transcription elongation factor Elf1
MEPETVELCCPICHRIFSVTVKDATKQDGDVKCPLCGVTSTYGVSQMLKFAA